MRCLTSPCGAIKSIDVLYNVFGKLRIPSREIFFISLLSEGSPLEVNSRSFDSTRSLSTTTSSRFFVLHVVYILDTGSLLGDLYTESIYTLALLLYDIPNVRYYMI